MNALSTAIASSIQMTSKEIAELTGKRHDHVLRDIDTLVATLPPELGNGFETSTYISGDPPREYRQILLDRDASYCLVTGYDAVSRMRIIKRWQELEKGKVPTTYIEMLRAHLATEEAKEAALLQIEADRPYTALGRALVASDETMVRRDWVNLLKKEQGLQVGEKKVDAWLIESGYCYRENIANNLRAYAQFAHLLKLEMETVTAGGKSLQVKILKLTGQGILELTPLVLSHFNGNQ